MLLVELRVDAAGSGSSAATSTTPAPAAGTSHRSAPRRAPPSTAPPGPGPRSGRTPPGATALGSAALAASDGGAAVVTLRTDSRLNVLPSGTDIPVIVFRAGDELRRIGLEMETEQGVQLPDAVPFGGVQMTLREAFRAAGWSCTTPASSR